MPKLCKDSSVLVLLGLLMTAHLSFIGFHAQGKDGLRDFQNAANGYVGVLLALLAPLKTTRR